MYIQPTYRRVLYIYSVQGRKLVFSPTIYPALLYIAYMLQGRFALIRKSAAVFFYIIYINRFKENKTVVDVKSIFVKKFELRTLFLPVHSIELIAQFMRNC